MKKCPECGSNKVIIFDSDNDSCKNCGKWFPAVKEVTFWAILFDDADVKPEVFTDEKSARERFRGVSDTFNCHLFKHIESR